MAEASYTESDFNLARQLGKSHPEQLHPDILGCLRYYCQEAVSKATSLINKQYDTQVTPQEVSNVFVNFCKGMQYAYEKYGHTPEGIHVRNSITYGEKSAYNSVHYSEDDKCVWMTTGFIENEIAGARLQAENPDKTIKSAKETGRKWTASFYPEVTILLGVEEAFHCHQYKREGEPLDVAYEGGSRKEHYRNNLMEIEAGYALAQATTDLNMRSRIGEPYHSGNFEAHRQALENGTMGRYVLSCHVNNLKRRITNLFSPSDDPVAQFAAPSILPVDMPASSVNSVPETVRGILPILPETIVNAPNESLESIPDTSATQSTAYRKPKSPQIFR